MLDRAIFGKSTKSCAQNGTNVFGAFQQTFAFDDLDVLERGCAHGGVSRVCVAVAQEKVRIRLESIAHLARNKNSTEWLVARGDAFCKAQ